MEVFNFKLFAELTDFCAYVQQNILSSNDQP
jgi:hypothetical protein